MIYTVFIIIISIVIWLCFVDYKGVFSDKLLCAVMFPFMAFVSSNADKAAYLIMYDYIDNVSKIGFTDPGFGLLMYVGRVFQLDYTGFLIFLAIVGIVFILLTLRRTCKFPATVFAVYFVMLYPTFTVQIRCFIAETILYILLVKIVNEERFEVKGFFFLLILAILFHASSFFFILLLLIPIIKDYKKLMCVLMISMLVVPVSAYVLKYVPIPMIQEKIQYYFNFRNNLSIGSLGIVGIYLMITAAVYYVMSITSNQEWKRKLKHLFMINLIGLVSCAMILVFNSNYYRMNRIIIFTDIIVLSNLCYESRVRNSKIRCVIGLFFAAGFVGWEYMSSGLFNIATNNFVLAPFLEII